jgi:uncharacterized repeat protein (TIGR03803 family)
LGKKSPLSLIVKGVSMTRHGRIAAIGFGTTATVFAAGVVVLVSAAAVAHGQTLTALHSFEGTDGTGPYAGVTMDSRGDLYGVTENGGLQNCDLGGPIGCGVVFKLTKENSSWNFSLLFEFGANTHLPSYPSQIVLGPDGALYGAELEGGPPELQGTIYHLLPPLSAASATANSFWTYKLVHQFGIGNDGTYPHKFIFDGSGNIFGVTGRGGTFNYGTVYELSPSAQGWTENILYNFEGGTDGLLPKAVVLDDAGNLYGTTEQGGNPGCSPFQGCGTIFELSPSGSGWIKTTLYSFNQNTDSGYPSALMRDSSGNLFGATSQTGPDSFLGGIWELSPSNNGWVFKILYSFDNNTVAYLGPFAPVMDGNGALYGVNNTGGTNNCSQMFGILCGNIYKLTPAGDHWVYTDILDFAPDDGGCFPVGPVVLDASGNLYGADYGCGAFGAGTVWKFTPSQ